MGKKKAKNKSKAAGFEAIFYFLACTCILPFIIDNKYFNLLETKAKGYLNLAVITAVLFVLLAVYRKISGKSFECFRHSGFNGLDICVLAFGVLAVVSSLFSDDIKASLTGDDGWSMGGIIIAVMTASYFLMSRVRVDYKKLWLVAAAASIIIFVIGVFHSASVDIFDLHRGILKSQYFWYISTIGNINWFVGYLCLLLPVFFVFFLNSESGAEYFLYGAASILGLFNTVLSASDGIYLGLGFFAVFFAAYVMQDNDRISKTAALVCAFGLSLTAVNYLPCFAAKKADLDGLSKLVVTSGVGPIIAAVGAACAILTLVFKEKIGKRIRISLLVIFELVLVGTIVGVFIYSVKEFNSQWGHSRGAIWMTSIDVYRGFGAFRRFIGCGTDMLGNYLGSLDDTFARVVLNAHNEYIQYLLTGGIAGLIAYVGMYISAAVGFITSRKQSPAIFAYMLAITAYAAQAAVNNPQALNFALLFMILGLLRGQMCKKEKSLKPQKENKKTASA